MRQGLFVVCLMAVLALGCAKKKERPALTPATPASAAEKAEADEPTATQKGSVEKAAADKEAADKARAEKAKVPPAPKGPQGTPLVDGAPPFEDVTLSKAKKTRKSKGLKYVPAAKNGDFQIYTLHSASDKNGKRSFGERATKAFYTKTAMGDLAMVSEVVPNPKDQSKAAVLGNYIYHRAKKGKYKGSYQVVGKPNLMANKPRILDNPELRVTKKKTIYPAEKNRYMITATPDAIQTITVHGKTYKKALRMKRTWTRVFAGERVNALELSWWARGVGKVASLSRFYGDDQEQTWMLWLLLDSGNTNNPHDLVKYLRKMSKDEVKKHEDNTAIINAQLAKDKAAKRAAPTAPEKALPALLGVPRHKVVSMLKADLTMVAKGKPRTSPMVWGKLGKISIESQLYVCTAKSVNNCRLEGIMLFSNAFTGSVVGGMTIAPVAGRRSKLVRTATTLFGLMAGNAQIPAVQRWLGSQFVGNKPAVKKFGKYEVFMAKARNGKNWNIAVNLK